MADGEARLIALQHAVALHMGCCTHPDEVEAKQIVEDAQEFLAFIQPTV